MTMDFLAWFLAQKPARKFRLVMKNGFERCVDKPQHVAFVGNDKILVGPDLGMGRVTVDLADVEEIRL